MSVGGVLEFEGVAGAVPYRLARRTRAAAGILELSTDTDVLAVRSAGPTLRADLSLGWGAAIVRGVGLPCSALEVGFNLPPDDPRAVELDGTAWSPATGSTLTFHATPGSRRRLRVEFREEVSLHRLGTRGPWVLLRYEGPDRSVIQGWVPRSRVRPGPYHFTGGARCPAGRSACGIGRFRDPDLRTGPAIVARGTRVHAEPDRGPWARVAREEQMIVVWRRGDPWARLVQIPGISEGAPCTPLAHAWVPSASVRFLDP